MDASGDYRGLLSLYKQAEDLLHTLGVDTAVDTSAVNELRYAGRHTLDALAAAADGDAEEEEKQISRAKAHCERAMYDAYDAAIFYYLKAFEGFEDDYKMIVVTDVLPDYVDIVADLNGARRFLAPGPLHAKAQRADRAMQGKALAFPPAMLYERVHGGRLRQAGGGGRRGRGAGGAGGRAPAPTADVARPAVA